jgi:xylulose-5-phosphate/fructose-6-phosphate phosphoketolase
VDVESPGGSQAEATRVMGSYLRDVVRLNTEGRNFRLMGPDETASNRLDNVFEATDRVWMEKIKPYDVHLARQGRVMEVLSEHLCQGWLEGYLLTGRHGLFNCYEAFVHYRRFDVQPACQVVESVEDTTLAPAHRLSELSTDLARLAAGP